MKNRGLLAGNVLAIRRILAKKTGKIAHHFMRDYFTHSLFFHSRLVVQDDHLSRPLVILFIKVYRETESQREIYTKANSQLSSKETRDVICAELL